MIEGLDDWLEAEAASCAKDFDARAEKVRRKMVLERTKTDAGIGVYTAEELAAHEAEEASEDDES